MGERIAIACQVDAANDVATISTQSPLALKPDNVVSVPFHAIEMLYLQILNIRLQRQQAALTGSVAQATPEQAAEIVKKTHVM